MKGNQTNRDMKNIWNIRKTIMKDFVINELNKNIIFLIKHIKGGWNNSTNIY